MYEGTFMISAHPLREKNSGDPKPAAKDLCTGELSTSIAINKGHRASSETAVASVPQFQILGQLLLRTALQIEGTFPTAKRIMYAPIAIAGTISCRLIGTGARQNFRTWPSIPAQRSPPRTRKLRAMFRLGPRTLRGIPK